MISEEIKTQFDKTFALFSDNKAILETGFSNKDRYYFTNYLGNVGSEYRSAIYSNSFSGNKTKLQIKTLNEFIQLSLKYIDQSIKVNKREDGLYHAYNLISIKGESISIRYLYEMLEGQVAILSSGYLSTIESLEVLNALKKSDLFRHDQFSYMLYPNRELPRFFEKNNIREQRIRESKLFQKLIADKNSSILTVDSTGKFHFNGNFRNVAFLEQALQHLDKETYGELLEKDKKLILDIYEELFDHQSFTGRSGTFFGYEGLGSIYWHMVSKLLLAVQENYFKGKNDNSDAVTLGKIKDHYYEIKAGIGLYKSPELYGAFPTDAYSHTPANAGVKQPGLTGQVKEDIISRLGELGIQIVGGKITFNPSLLNRDEILTHNESFDYFDISGNKKSIKLNKQQLGFTFCQVPVICTFGKEEQIIVTFSNGELKEFRGNVLPEKISSKIYARSGEVEKIEFYSPI